MLSTIKNPSSTTTKGGKTKTKTKKIIKREGNVFFSYYSTSVNRRDPTNCKTDSFLPLTARLTPSFLPPPDFEA
jgi:hypothetical protein